MLNYNSLDIMSIKYCFYILFLVFGNTIVSEQQLVEGKVVDSETGEPLPYSHIKIAGSTYGTVANEEGYFSLSTDQLPVILSISYIGYEGIEIDVPDNNSISVELSPSVVSSDEIIVSDDYEINILKRAVENILSDSSRGFGKAFYRQVTHTDTIASEFIEIFYGAELSANKVEQWKIENGRYAVIPYDSLEYRAVNHNFTTFSTEGLVSVPPHWSSQTIWPLRSDMGNYYNFYFKTRYEQAGKNSIVFSFEGKSGVDVPTYEGTITILEDDLEILELDATISHPDLNPFSFPQRRTETQNTVLNFRIVREKMLNEKYTPRFVEVSTEYQFVKKKGVFGRTDYTRDIKTGSMMFFYDYQSIETSPLANDKFFAKNDRDQSDFRTIDQTDYDPEFWKDNPIIRRTPVEESIIESFERYGSFGKMFNEQQ